MAGEDAKFTLGWDITFWVALGVNIFLAYLIWMKMTYLYAIQRGFRTSLMFSIALLVIVILRGTQFFLHAWNWSFSAGIIWVVPSYLFFLIYCYMVFLWAKIVYYTRNMRISDSYGKGPKAVFWFSQLTIVTMFIIIILFIFRFPDSPYPVLVCDYFFMLLQASAAIAFYLVGCYLYGMIRNLHARTLLPRKVLKQRRRMSRMILLTTLVCTFAFNAKVLRVALWHVLDLQGDFILFFVLYPFCEVLPILLMTFTIHTGKQPSQSSAVSPKSAKELRQAEVRQRFLERREREAAENDLRTSLLGARGEADFREQEAVAEPSDVFSPEDVGALDVRELSTDVGQNPVVRNMQNATDASHLVRLESSGSQLADENEKDEMEEVSLEPDVRNDVMNDNPVEGNGVRRSVIDDVLMYDANSLEPFSNPAARPNSSRFAVEDSPWVSFGDNDLKSHKQERGSVPCGLVQAKDVSLLLGEQTQDDTAPMARF